jgi:FkbM family methyltransferase
MNTGVALDVGGYDGNDTAHYLRMGCFQKVVCIEADPSRAAQIAARFAAEIKTGACEVLNIAVGDREGTLPFYLSRRMPIWNSFDRASAARGGEVDEIFVTTKRFADVLALYGQPDFVKIDVEGADWMCLQSMASTPYIPRYLSCEASKEKGADMILLLAKCGYTKFSLVRQDSFMPIVLPTPGTIGSIVWSVRQWLRLQLRKHQWIHGVLRALKPSREGTKPTSSGDGTTFKIDSAGPTPMEREREHGWYSPGEFLWLWQNVVHSGMIDSVWYDVHAVKEA